MEFEAGTIFGPYRILARIGRGGMAEIYLASRTGPGGFSRDVVLKRILPQRAADPEFVRMFVDEAGLLSRLTHSNIAQVYEFGEIEGSHYLAMEYVRGISLDRLIRVFERPGLPIAHAARIAAEVARGLDHAHRATDARGRPLAIVHRDVSPTNVLVSYEGEVKLIDFGIARSAVRATETAAGTVKGKVRYMSPEQCRGRPLDPRSDVFSLGIVLWEALTGELLFPQSETFDVMEAIVQQPIVPPSVRRPEVPPELDGVVLRALAKTPEERYGAAGDMAQALDAFLAERRLLSNAQLLSELLRMRFAPSLVVPVDGPRSAAEGLAETVAATAGATLHLAARDGRGAAVSSIPSPEGARRPAEIPVARLVLPSPATGVTTGVTPMTPRGTVVDRGGDLRGGGPFDGALGGPASRWRDAEAETASGAAGSVTGREVPSGPDGDRSERRRGTGSRTAVRGRARLRKILPWAAVGAAIVVAAIVVVSGRSPEGVGTGSAPPEVSASAAGGARARPDRGDAGGDDSEDGRARSAPLPAGAGGSGGSGEGGATPAADGAEVRAGDERGVRGGDGGGVHGADGGDVGDEAGRGDGAAEGDSGGGPGLGVASGGEEGAAREAPTGRVRLDSTPWSVVTWRGRRLGETPVLDAELPAGTQQFVFTDEEGRRYRCSVRVVAHELVKVRFDLAAECR
ncbi:MAG: serine/threonine protein kinase [Deltaproteobacteria bacterium]|nr:serine/threonine protein kinase [Deltaproteobacteria bacterium]